MKNKRVVVLLKFFKGELNPFDGAALEAALCSGAKEIVALTMSPMNVLDPLKAITRLGVRAILISDKAYAGADTIATSLVLAEAIARLDADFVYCGRQSVDGDTAQTPPMIAKRLGYDYIGKIMETDGEKVTTRTGESFEPKDKTVLTFERIKTLRFPSIFSKIGEVEIWDNSRLQIPIEKCGQLGSPTRVIKSYESNVGRRDCTFVQVEELSKLIETGLKKERVKQPQTLKEKLDKAYYVGNVKAVAQSIANSAIELKTDGKEAEEIAQEIREKHIKTVLWEDSDSLKKLAAQTAVLLGAGLCADCISFRVEKEKLVMTRPALGGNITADIVCESEVAFATVRTVKAECSDVIFAVGKGAMDEVERIKELARKYGAEVCCSRIVADSGKLPYEKQVGLTGRTVCPKIYVAFGISGAVQHTCAISGAGTVIAVNVNKNERIFDYADYGIIAEVNHVKL